MTSTFIYDAVRTPFGRAAGALSGVRPDDLAAHVMRSIVERTSIDPARIEDVIFGDANQAGEDNRKPARLRAPPAGLPTCLLYTSPATDERSRVDPGGRRIIKKKKKQKYTKNEEIFEDQLQSLLTQHPVTSK